MNYDGNAIDPIGKDLLQKMNLFVLLHVCGTWPLGLLDGQTVGILGPN